MTLAPLTIALALMAGILAQTVAHHLRIPGIVLLLAAGATLGPDGLGLIDPGSVSGALHALIGYAVAVILFEGGLNLTWSRLRHESGVIQMLITVGGLVTALGAATAAHFALQWDWRTSVLFGTLVIVTGPTVVTPLLRRIKIDRKLHTILEAEGVLIDPIGAIIAVVTLEVMLSQDTGSFVSALWGGAAKLGLGIAIGAMGGLLIALLLRPARLIPQGLENVFTLGAVWAVFHVADAVQSESGIMAATAAGLVVGNIRSRALRELMEFKEGMTLLLIGMLFVLLAADLRIAELRELGWPGLLTVALLMFVVRPLTIALSTAGSTLNWRERLFLMWLSPRGIVAAAVATFFAESMATHGMPGGEMLQAMVFLVIAVTVTVQGLTGGAVARWLGVRRARRAGYAILGANEVGRLLGRLLHDAGQEVVFLESNADAVRTAQHDGFRVVYGNALEESTLQRASMEDAEACVALTANEEVNLLVVRRVRRDFRVPRSYIVRSGSVTGDMIRESAAHILFGESQDIGLWCVRLRRRITVEQRWTCVRADGRQWPAGTRIPDVPENVILPLVLTRNGRPTPFHEAITVRKGDVLTLLTLSEHAERVGQWLVSQGWASGPSNPATAPTRL